MEVIQFNLLLRMLKSRRKKSGILSNNENGVKHSQENSGSTYNVSENAMQIA